MKKGLIIALVIVGVLLVIGLAYYFLIYKKEKSQREGTNGTTGTTGTIGIGSSVVVDIEPCVPYTQAQQDADMQKCASDCSKKTPMQQMGCMVACNTHKKPLKTC